MNEIRAEKRVDNQLPEELVSDRDGTVQRFDSALVAPPSRRFDSPTRVLELDGHAPAATEPFLRNKPKRILTKLSILVAVLLALLTLALYWPVVHFDFVHYDDNDYVFDNQTVRAGLTWWGLVWSFVDAHALNWHPVTWLSHMLDCQLFGLNPGAHHFVNVLLHCANTALLFLLLRALTEPEVASPSPWGERRDGAKSSWSIGWRCVFVAALFAWHPLRVESVAWVSERKDVLSSFFFMLTLLMYVKYHETEDKRQEREAGSQELVTTRQFSIFNFQCPIPNLSRSLTHSHYYGLSLAFYTLGLLSKSMLVTVPFILLLLDVWPLRRFAAPASGIRHVLREKLPFFALSLAVAIITFFSQRSGGSLVSLHSEGISARIATALAGYLGYLEKMVWPRDLAIIYLRPSSIPASTVILGASVLLILSVLAVRSLFTGIRASQNSKLKIQDSRLAIGWLWYVIMLLPVCGLVQVGPQLIADRYTYLPSIGLAIILAWTVPDLLAHLFNVLTLKRFNALIATALLLTCALLTRHQLAYWRNTETLMTHALAINPNNPIAHMDLAVYYSKLGQIDAARAHRQKVRELDPAPH